MRQFFIKRGVYAVIVTTAVFTYVLGVSIQRYFPPLSDLTALSLMAPKVTLLSVIIALGLVQYNYFYTQCREIQDRLEKKDFGPLWADYIKEAEKLQAALNRPDPHSQVTPEQFESLRETLRHMDESIEEAQNEWIQFMRKALADFSIRFGILFSIALLILGSIILDFIFQVWRLSWLNPGFYSLVAFLMSIILALVYLLFLVFLVQTQVRGYQRPN